MDMLTLLPTPLLSEATVTLPASKSISNRVIILNALAYGDESLLHNLAQCDDTDVLLRALRSNDNRFDIGAAGTSMRFLTAYFSRIVGEWHLTGSLRMQQRPIALLVDALRTLGASIAYEGREGFPPLRIQGSLLTGGDLSLDGGVSSQYISALLMIAPYTQQGVRLTLTGNIVSRPYIAMTLALMKQYGVHSHWEGHTITVAPQQYVPLDFTVENDWSAASYWYQIVALAPHTVITLRGLSARSLQGDARVAAYYESLGVSTQYTQEGVVLRRNLTPARQLTLDLVEQPDLAQSIVAAACALGIPFCISGLQSLKIKETDRLAALQCELAKLGYPITCIADAILQWGGQRNTPLSNVLDTYDDHRMAMCLAPLALTCGELRICHPEVVTKSYPHYWDHLAAVGFTPTLTSSETH